MLAVLALLGVLAGVLTTLAGQGGGVVLTLCLALVVSPKDALVLTVPALFLGNLHRAYLFRAHVHRGFAIRLATGAVPAALVAGFYVGHAPAWIVKAMLVAVTALAVARALGYLTFPPPRGALVPAGAVVGALVATAGGAGVLLSPILLACGLTGSAFVGTNAAVAVLIHAGRIAAYVGSGLFRPDLYAATLVLAATILVGNTAGERLRKRLSPRATTRIEYGTLLVCVTLALAGVTT